MRLIQRYIKPWALAALMLALVPAASFAQSQVARTTFATAVTATATRLTLTAASNAAVGKFLFVEGELMPIEAVSGTTVTVRRGGTSPHSTAVIVWVGGAAELPSYNVSGSCTATAVRYLPHINVKENRIFDCRNGAWIERDTWRRDYPLSTTVLCNGRNWCRDEFNQGYLVMQDDGTAKSLSDTEVNFVYGSPLGGVEYREEQAKTVSSWVTINGQLDISADDTTASEGVEIIWGGGASATAALNQQLEVGTNGGCIAAMVTIADISQVTQLQFGWRQNEAYVDAAAYTGYTRWSTIGLTTTNGAITSSEEVSSSTTTDLSGVTWADGERRALKVCISSAGRPTAYYTAASPDTDEPIWRPITMTNTGVVQTSGTGMVAFMTFLAAGSTDAGVTIQWVQIERAP